MKKIIRSLIQNKKITLFFVFALIVSGALAFIEMPKQESPDFTIPYAMITTVFPGASQNDVDQYVTVPIEETIKTIDGYKSSFSYSSNNLSLVILEFEFSSDKEESFRKLEEEMATLQKSLPENCGQIDVNTNITDTAGVLLSSVVGGAYKQAGGRPGEICKGQIKRDRRLRALRNNRRPGFYYIG